MTATLKRTFDVPIPDNGTTDLTIKGLLVTNNNKLVIAQEEVVGYGSKTKVMVVSLDNVDEIKEIDMGASEEFADMTLLSDGLVAIALMYDEKILLVDVSGAEPVTSASLTPSREYAQFGVAAGTGDELIIAGWTTDYVGHVDVMSRQEMVQSAPRTRYAEWK
ncbi:hypothetical protein BaRGS_00009587 [Batillaria attramentaria]|uniref:Uncharacterized protein n=1 Tax=Batillaria attramentaria TaxID=370345 RepID=A0ABD0LHS3_9CAEN